MAKIFDFNKLSGLPYVERHKNVLYKTEDFKLRVIDLQEKGFVPECTMDTHVVFVIMQGQVDITINGNVHHLSEKQSLVSGPAVFSMNTDKGAKLMGVQINKTGA